MYVQKVLILNFVWENSKQGKLIVSLNIVKVNIYPKSLTPMQNILKDIHEPEAKTSESSKLLQN